MKLSLLSLITSGDYMDYKWKAVSVTGLGSFSLSFTSSMLFVALPTIMMDLNVDLTIGSLIISSIWLVTLTLLVSIGRIADMFGRARLYFLGFIFYGIGSTLCAFANSGLLLLAFRIVQGIGSALFIANSIAIVTDAFPKNELGLGLGVHTTALNLGQILGYALSGFFIATFGWQAIFLINLPISAFGALWAKYILKDINATTKHEAFDIPGAVLYSAAIAIAMGAFSLGDVYSTNFAIMSILSIVLLVAFVFTEKHAKYPIIDPRLLKIRSFIAGNICNALNILTYVSIPFLLSLYLQLIWNLSPSDTGLLFVTLGLSRVTITAISGKLSDIYGTRWISTIGLVIFSVALIYLSGIPDSISYGYIIIGLILAGLGRGIFMTPNTKGIMSEVPPERRGIANAVRATISQTFNTLNTPLIVTFMSLFVSPALISQAISTGVITDIFKAQFANGIRNTFLILAIINGISIIPSILREPFYKAMK